MTSSGRLEKGKPREEPKIRSKPQRSQSQARNVSSHRRSSNYCFQQDAKAKKEDDLIEFEETTRRIEKDAMTRSIERDDTKLPASQQGKEAALRQQFRPTSKKKKKKRRKILSFSQATVSLDATHWRPYPNFRCTNLLTCPLGINIMLTASLILFLAAAAAAIATCYSVSPSSNTTSALKRKSESGSSGLHLSSSSSSWSLFSSTIENSDKEGELETRDRTRRRRRRRNSHAEEETEDHHHHQHHRNDREQTRRRRSSSEEEEEAKERDLLQGFGQRQLLAAKDPRPGVNQPANHLRATGTNDAGANAGKLRRPRRAAPAAAIKSQPLSSAVGGGGGGGSSRQRPSSSSAINAQAQAQAEQSTGDARQQAGKSIKDVTAQNGQSVLLHCLVEPDDTGSPPLVSWFRGTGEMQLLTYDTNTIIQDERFLVRKGIAKNEKDVALQIKSVDKATDGGIYQCQTSSDSTQIQTYQLNIVEPQVSILDAPDLAVRLGAPINLTCVISQSADQLQFVFWYRDSRMINYDLTSEGRGKIVASKLASSKQDAISSNLQIFQSRLSDSGNYTCAPSGARSTSVYVHVLEASDERLIMFQNDETNPLTASSQHQTNSAVSTQVVVRLSRGRAYAILVGLLIFATWFQLVTQLQTGISLLLVAIIGLFLSHSSERAQGASERDNMKRSRSERKKKNKKKKGETETSESLDLSVGEQNTRDESRDPLLERAKDALNLLRTLSELERGSQCSSVELEQDEDNEHGFRSPCMGQLGEQRRRRAAAASGTLGALSEHDKLAALETTETLLRVNSITKQRAGRAVRTAGQLNRARINQEQAGSPQQPQQQQQQRASPGGSAAYSPASTSSSSADSTGYNSDSRTSCRASSATGGCCGHQTRRAMTPNVSLINEQQEREADGENLDGRELEMVELLRDRPTALKLVIERLEQSSRSSSKTLNSLPLNLAGHLDNCGNCGGNSSAGTNTTRPRHRTSSEINASAAFGESGGGGGQGGEKCDKLNGGAQEDPSEQIYSVPSSASSTIVRAEREPQVVERQTPSATFERQD